MIKYTPNHNSYIRLIDCIIPYDTTSIGLHFNNQLALKRLGNELPNIDQHIKSFGSYIISPEIYDDLMKEFFITDSTYDNFNKQYGFKTDLRRLYRLPYIWDLVQFCNAYNLDPISFGIFKNFKLGFW